jgi:hypothetical protein
MRPEKVKVGNAWDWLIYALVIALGIFLVLFATS